MLVARKSATATSTPRFAMVRKPRVDTRRLTKRFSDSSQKRWLCKLGRKRRRLRLFACETVLPVLGPLPVTWQTRDMAKPLNLEAFTGAGLYTRVDSSRQDPQPNNGPDSTGCGTVDPIASAGRRARTGSARYRHIRSRFEPDHRGRQTPSSRCSRIFARLA